MNSLYHSTFFYQFEKSAKKALFPFTSLVKGCHSKTDKSYVLFCVTEFIPYKNQPVILVFHTCCRDALNEVTLRKEEENDQRQHREK
jgi:hypothetical protein